MVWRVPEPQVFNIIVRYWCKQKMPKINWNWRNSWLFVTFLSLVKFQLGGRPAWLSLCSNCGKQKRYLQIFHEVSGAFQQNFNGSKNSAVLEPRTGQFSRTYGFEAKAKDLRLRGQGLQKVFSRTSSRPRTSSRTPPLATVIKKINKNCNCNYILFTKLPWPGDSEVTFRSSSQAAACPPVYHTRWRLHTVPLIAERQAGKLWIPIFIVFGLTRPGIEPESAASVADALSTRPLIG